MMHGQIKIKTLHGSFNKKLTITIGYIKTIIHWKEEASNIKGQNLGENILQTEEHFFTLYRNKLSGET